MNIYAIPPLISAILLLVFGLFVLFKNTKLKINITCALSCFSACVWLIGYSLMYNSKDEKAALFWARFGYNGVIFIPIFAYHFVLSLFGIKRRTTTIILVYLMVIPFLIANQTNYFLRGMYVYFWGYYPKVAFIYIYFVLFFTIIFLRCTALSYISMKEKKGKSPLQYNQAKYVLLAFAIASTSVIDYVQNYGIEIYPWGYISATGWFILMVIAVTKHRLMDISVAITRTGIFIAVYTLVLGLPFAVAFWMKNWLVEILGPGWWMLPLGLMAVLATVGPFIYIYVQRRAEARLLKEQRRYQQILKQASLGMTRIRNLRKLLDLITHIVTKTVKISYAAIYLYNRQSDEYVLQISRDKGRMSIPSLSSNNPLISWIVNRRELLLYEEVKRQAQDYFDADYKRLEENMRLLTASMIIPSFLEDKFMGFIVLGDKLSGQIYTPEDLSVFQVLASQAALAIENAQFYEEAKEMQEQIGQAEKMATIGTMADGLSHQINNRFYALSLIAGDTVDTIKMTDTSQCSPEVKQMIGDINHALQRIQTNVMQGGEVVKGILKYTRKGEEGLTAVSLDEILDGTLEMVQYKIKLSEIDIVRDYPKDTPKINGNLVQLQEAFFNFIDNAYDAIVERKTTLKEEGYRGRITVSAHPKDTILEIVVEDNGMGMQDDQAKKLFTPFFTTKTSSRKGTGLGLYVVRRIITDMHKGKITFESDYKLGTRFILELPIAK
jgi:signal transduction histidine kinase